MTRNPERNWKAPLPFKKKKYFPNSKLMVLKRAMLMDTFLKIMTKKREHFVAFMKKVIESVAVKVAPEIEDG
jgi:hypothetical protein